MNSNMVIFVGPEIATGKKELPYGISTNAQGSNADNGKFLLIMLKA